MSHSEPKQTGTCAYCGKTKPVTRDHIPPRSLFPDPKPMDLITVPCCECCRKGWSKDDEYFRLNVISACAGYGDDAVENVNAKVLRSMEKETKVGFAQAVLESLREIEVMSAGGIYLGTTGGLVVDQKRIDRVAQRIIRGLFFREKSYPVPERYEVTNSFRQSGLSKILEALGQAVSYAEHRTVGHGMFAYTFAQTEEDPDSMVWLSLFYNRLPFAGFTVKAKHLRESVGEV